MNASVIRWLLIHLLWLVSQAAQAAEVREIVRYDSTWKFDESGDDLGTAWREPRFDDSAWQSGSGALGFPSDENLLGFTVIRTLLNRYISGDSGPQPRTYYFRYSFEWSGPPDGVNLTTTNLIDDGAVIYLNGVELGRIAMPMTPINYLSRATRSSSISTRGRDVARFLNVPLVEGQNVLAVELHQAETSSPDLVLGIEAWAELPPDGPPMIVSQPSPQARQVGEQVTFVVAVSGTPPYTYQWTRNDQDIPGATGSSYIIPAADYSHTGDYRVRVTNPLGTVLSEPARLIVFRTPLQLVRFDHSWRYENSGTDLGTAWREGGYDDTAWPAGPGPLGMEPGPLPLALRTLFALNTTITYYFRTTFQLDADPVDVQLRSTNLIDDGAVVYLNGVEVNRIGMALGPIRAQTPAGRTVDQAAFEPFTLPSTHLVPGLNTLAVELHQVTSTSTDAVFGMSLTAEFPPHTPLGIVVEPNDLMVTELEPAAFAVTVVGFAPRYQWFKDGMPIPGVTQPVLDFAEVRLSDAGEYQVRASNQVSVVYSQVARLDVIADLEPPYIELAVGQDTEIVITFSEDVDGETAANPAQYALRSTVGEILEVSSAEIVDSRTVRLQAVPRQEGVNYVVTSTGVADTSPQANSIPSAAPVSVMVELVAFTNVWAYYDPFPPLDPIEPEPGWGAIGFDDSSWGVGPAGFAFGQPQAEPTLPFQTALSGGSITTYFRAAFPELGSRAGRQLLLRHVIDDGVIFYLNGMEVLRSNLQPGLVGPTTRASQRVLFANTSMPAALPATGLQAPVNVLAAELHRFSPSDSALFAAELSARIASWPTGPIVVTRDPRDQTVIENRSVQFEFMAAGGQEFQWQANGQAIPGATNPVFALDHTPLDWDGLLFDVVLANETHRATSAVARLTVIPDTVPPDLLEVSGDHRTLLLTFSEPLAPESAERLGSYRLWLGVQPATILSATLVEDHQVLLTLAEASRIGWLRVYGIRDRASSNNTIAAGTGRTIGFSGVAVPFDAEWRYEDSDTDLGTAWREPGYDDSAWPEGRGLFGIEPSSLPELIRTPLLSPPDGGPSTVYFRKRFSWPGGLTPVLVLGHLIDDGVVLHLNGVEIHRLGVAVGNTHNSFALRTIDNAAYEGPYPLTLPSLVVGENVLAAQLYQVNQISNDAVFGLELTMDPVLSLPLPPEPVLQFRREEGGLRIWWETNGFVLETASNPTGPWTAVVDPSNPFSALPEDDQRFYRLKSEP